MCILEVGELGGGLEGSIGGMSCFTKYDGGYKAGGYECFAGGSYERVGGG